MAQPPEPPAEIPEFLVEYLEEQPVETLRLAADYLGGEVGVDEAPQRVVEAASLQDDETVAALRAFSTDLAAFLEDSDHENMAEAIAATDGDGDDEDGPGDDTMALRYGSL